MDKIIGKQLPKKDQDNEHWVSMSDLMAGLMMVFMFISIAYMHYVRIEKEKIKEVLEKNKLIYKIIDNCSTIAIVGIGMRGVPGIMAKIINTLGENSIEILQTADSNMTIWCLIQSDHISQALNLLHRVFNLGE